MTGRGRVCRGCPLAPSPNPSVGQTERYPRQVATRSCASFGPWGGSDRQETPQTPGGQEGGPGALQSTPGPCPWGQGRVPLSRCRAGTRPRRGMGSVGGRGLGGCPSPRAEPQPPHLRPQALWGCHLGVTGYLQEPIIHSLSIHSKCPPQAGQWCPCSDMGTKQAAACPEASW